MVKLKDVAKAAGMSVTQVSRALNNYDDVNEETKTRIKAIAKEMGYVKNITAQKLATGTSNQITFVIKGLDDRSNLVEYNSIYPILCGINGYTSQLQYEVVVYIVQEKVNSYVDYFKDKGINNAILFGFEYDDEAFIELINSTYTLVCIDIPIDGENKGCVITNNTFYATQAVDLLYKSGKQNIAMISGKNQAIVSIEREAGYRVALQKNKKIVDETLILNGEFREQKAKEVTLQVLKDHPEIDGFFCASDYMAIGCMEAIKSINKRIPEDIAVIGFDNMPVSRYVTPSLTTVAQDDYKKGYQAAELMSSLMKRECETKTVLMNCEIKIRASI